MVKNPVWNDEGSRVPTCLYLVSLSLQSGVSPHLSPYLLFRNQTKDLPLMYFLEHPFVILALKDKWLSNPA